LATEPFWYNQFWRLSISIVVPLWTIAFVFFAIESYNVFEGYENRKMGQIFGVKDEDWIYLEYFNHFKDLSYFLFRDHTRLFVWLFSFSMILPFTISFGQGGPISRYALLGKKMNDPKYPHARWLIKTNISIFENFPQTFLILLEIFQVK